MCAAEPAPAPLALDRLPARGEAVQVRWLRDALIGGVEGVREPHRHDYHELVWVRAGEGRQLVDGQPLELEPQTVTLIGRGQVHVFERASGLSGAVVRFGEELLAGGAAERAAPGWLLAGRGGRVLRVPDGEVARLEGVLGALGAEAGRPPDAASPELQRHLLSVLLLWLERWYEATRTERRAADDADVQLQRRFAQLLERDYATQHAAAHYATALRVPPAALSHALVQVTGRATKELILDRVMLEAARLLRFSDLSVQEVAQRTGFRDPFHFSRAFKRQRGEAPMTYRARSRGMSMPS